MSRQEKGLAVRWMVTKPSHSTGRPTMKITSFDDFCLWMYCQIDDAWKSMAHEFRRSGPEPTTCSDSAVLSLAILSECCGWDIETELQSRWQPHRHLFPSLPSQSRFNRRRRALQQ